MMLRDKLLEMAAGLCLLVMVACDSGAANNPETTSAEPQKKEKKKKDKNPATEGFAVNNNYTVEQVSKMDKKEVSESSGLEESADGNFWTHGDAGNDAVLYKISKGGDLLETVPVQGAKNNDWEDVARGTDGFLYIGDMGNNENTRRDLQILKVDDKANKVLGAILFAYADQTEFPPSKQNLNFDCEGFFLHNNAFYLFTKNRGKSDWVKLYKVANQTQGLQKVSPLDSLEMKTRITAADISPDGKQVALLGQGWIYLFGIDSPEQTFKGSKQQIPLSKVGQAEGLVFVDNQTMMISNESGKLFMVAPMK